MFLFCCGSKLKINYLLFSCCLQTTKSYEIRPIIVDCLKNKKFKNAYKDKANKRDINTHGGTSKKNIAVF